jgi:hypothetical protein
VPIAQRFWQDTRGVPLTANRNQKAPGPDPNGSIEDRSGAGVERAPLFRAAERPFKNCRGARKGAWKKTEAYEPGIGKAEPG